MAGSVSNYLFSQALCQDTTKIVFSYFSAQELCLLSRVCQFWNGIANQDNLWEGLLQKEFKRSEIALNKNIPIKEVFQRSLELRHQLEKEKNNRIMQINEEKKDYEMVQLHYIEPRCPKDDFELLI